ncbi:MAG: energy transducer TonB [Actinomycetota bacterium]
MDAVDWVAGLLDYDSVKMRRFFAGALIAATACIMIASSLAQTPQPSPAGPKPLQMRVTPGMLVKKVPPHYPREARKKHISGDVILEFTISRKGSVENLRVVSGEPILARAAVEAVQKWKYRPYLLNGEPVDVESTTTIRFRM